MRGNSYKGLLSSSRLTSAGIGTSALRGCRGFAGPVPQPLWMSVILLYRLLGASLPYWIKYVKFTLYSACGC